MAQEEHWTERRERAVKCKVHGLHYDPRLTSGCNLCRKEGLLAAPPRQRPQLVLMLLSLLAVAVILYRVFGTGAVSANGGVQPAVSTAPAAISAAASARLDPAPHRAAIEAVDQAVFESPAESLIEIGEQATSALRRLRADLAVAPANAAAVTDLDELIDGAAAEVFSLERLAELRREWTRIRNRTFLNAPWFLSMVGVDARTGRAALVIYRGAADELASLLDEGADRAENLWKPSAPNVDDPEERARREEEWRGYANDWRQRIEVLRDELPPRASATADPQVLLAVQRLEQAFARASSLAAANLPPQAAFSDAVDTVERARESFEDLLSR